MFEPKAIFGARLEGSSPVHYIYVDEAGTSAREPVSVVVGILVHADTRWRAAHDALMACFEMVPPKYRERFFFHAESIWGNEKFRDGWSKDERLHFLKSVMSIPAKLDLPVAVGVARRMPPGGYAGAKNIRSEHMDYCLAFDFCIASADRLIARAMPANEVATVIAEECTQTKRQIEFSLEYLRKGVPGYDLPLRPTLAEIEAGRITQDPNFRVTRIIDTVHFVKKADAPLLQIADACAYGFRRYFSNQTHGREYVDTITDNQFVYEDWDGPLSGSVFYRKRARLQQI